MPSRLLSCNAVNLALGLTSVEKVYSYQPCAACNQNCDVQGLSVGLLDADVYGPSIPQMMSLSGQPELSKRMQYYNYITNFF